MELLKLLWAHYRSYPNNKALKIEMNSFFESKMTILLAFCALIVPLLALSNEQESKLFDLLSTGNNQMVNGISSELNKVFHMGHSSTRDLAWTKFSTDTNGEVDIINHSSL